MRKIILILAVTLLFIWGCTDNDEAQVSQTEQHEHADGYYTCPMHPTIVQDEPGDCPICGMDLVKFLQKILTILMFLPSIQ